MIEPFDSGDASLCTPAVSPLTKAALGIGAAATIWEIGFTDGKYLSSSDSNIGRKDLLVVFRT
jgi:hypothetical protein